MWIQTETPRLILTDPIDMEERGGGGVGLRERGNRQKSTIRKDQLTGVCVRQIEGVEYLESNRLLLFGPFPRQVFVLRDECPGGHVLRVHLSV